MDIILSWLTAPMWWVGVGVGLLLGFLMLVLVLRHVLRTARTW